MSGRSSTISHGIRVACALPAFPRIGYRNCAHVNCWRRKSAVRALKEPKPKEPKLKESKLKEPKQSGKNCWTRSANDSGVCGPSIAGPTVGRRPRLSCRMGWHPRHQRSAYRPLGRRDIGASGRVEPSRAFQPAERGLFQAAGSDGFGGLLLCAGGDRL